ncbi:MAG: ABC transporter substrate-binding protein [Actinomycetes bacterium]
MNRPALAGLGALAVLLTGCFSAPTTEEPGTAGESRIRLAMLQPPRSGLSPLSDDAFKLSRWHTAETLVVLNPAGDAEPGLATSWTRRDPRTWAFTVREGVRFHDGTPFTAREAAAALTAADRAAPKPRILDGVALSATAESPTTVVVTTGRPDPLVPQRLSSPQLAILAPKAYATKGVVDPVGTGTGPFVLTEVNGTASARLDRFDGYWGGPAASPGIDVDFVPDGAARAAALRTGSADVVEAIPVAQAPLLDPALVHEVPMPRTNTLYLNTERGPLADPDLRAAVAAAVDREPIVSSVYEGRADVAAGLLGPALPWAAELRQPIAPARSTRVPAGTTLALGTFTDRAELPEVAVRLQQQLEAVGFSVQQDVREYAQIEADALAGKFDAFILSRATVLDSGDPVAYLYSDFACDGSFNIAQLCDADVDAALTRAAALPAGPERRAATLAAEQLILQTRAAVPMLHERVIQGESARVDEVARDPRERILITPTTRVAAE